MKPSLDEPAIILAFKAKIFKNILVGVCFLHVHSSNHRMLVVVSSVRESDQSQLSILSDDY